MTATASPVELMKRIAERNADQADTTPASVEPATDPKELRELHAEARKRGGVVLLLKGLTARVCYFRDDAVEKARRNKLRADGVVPYSHESPWTYEPYLEDGQPVWWAHPKWGDRLQCEVWADRVTRSGVR